MNHSTQSSVCKADTPPLLALAGAMRAGKLDFWLQGTTDEFQGEYPPACAQRLSYLSGFTGSAGLGVFRASGKHALFVDGRYTLQATNETGAELFAIINSGDVTLSEWLEGEVSTPVTIGFDPWLFTEQQVSGWKKHTAGLPVTWKAVSPNLVDGFWEERPAAPAGEVRLHPPELAGVPYEEKRGILLDAMEKHRADALIITMPDAVNWLLNIRGEDIPYNPLFLCYFVLNKAGEGTVLSFDRTFSAGIRSYFESQKISWGNIEDIFSGKAKLFTKGARVMADPALSPHGWWITAGNEGWEIISAEDPTQLPKACKNAAELAAIREAHLRDGLAVTRFLHWFDAYFSSGAPTDELGAVAKLEDFRRMDSGYLGGSFPTIAGSGPHGAIVHYRVTEASNRRFRPGELFLLDSGGQYTGGTTDITRTVFVAGAKGGKPAAAMREHFTRVLKGHIALASAVFPEGTSGSQLDALARQFLWQAGLDYDHGTGHGVGAYLCVHEGPQRISKRASHVALKEGMILSNEPGYYAEGRYGIRIENLVVVKQVGKTERGKKLLGFETLTLAPIDVRLIDVTMLTAEERNWLNAYHRHVHKAHAEALDSEGARWLSAATRAI